jgi:hypothetical protein
VIQVPPPPRRIYRPLNLTILKGLGWLFFIVIIAATLVLILMLANEMALKFAGQDVTASVTSLHEHPNGGGTYDRIAKYTYTPVPGQPPRADSAPLNWGAFSELSKPFFTAEGRPTDMTFPPDRPGKLVLRAYALGPIAFARPVERENGFLFLLVPAIFVPLGLIFVLVLYYKVVVVSRRYRRLYTHGVAVPGVITDRRQHGDSDGVDWAIAYAFTPAGADGPIGGSMLVRSGDYARAVPGSEVTVLYDPTNPQKNTVCEYGGYRLTRFHAK